MTSVEAGAPGGGGASPVPAEALELCGRFANPVTVLDKASRKYASSVLNDCDVAGMLRPRLTELSDFLNAVYGWGYRFLGCSTPVVETEFGLTYHAQQLTRADAARLVDLYLAAARAEMSLSSREEGDIRRELERLAKAAIVDHESADFSMRWSQNPCAGSGGSSAGGATFGGATGQGGSAVAGANQGGSTSAVGGFQGSGGTSGSGGASPGSGGDSTSETGGTGS